tara:strand:- start:564 stop:746 length:183 start_codon:yes stop_codon:yes gene_type:complete
MTPHLKDMMLGNLIDYLSGWALIEIGRGTALRSIVSEIVRTTLEWKSERGKGRKTNEPTQ